MGKQLKNADELRQMIVKGFQNDATCQQCKPDYVYWHEPDNKGCNWDVHLVEGCCEDEWEAAAVARIVEELQGSYNLADKRPALH